MMVGDSTTQSAVSLLQEKIFILHWRNTMLVPESWKGDIMLQAHTALLRLTVCRELMPHNNGNLRFALYKSLFDVSQAHAGFGPLVVLWLHTFFLQSLLCSSWWAQWSHFTFKAHQTPSQVRQTFRTPPHGCIKRKRLHIGASEDLHLKGSEFKSQICIKLAL